MKIKQAIKDFKHLESYTQLIEKQILNDFWHLFFKPICKILDLTQKNIAQNSSDILIDAINKGAIFYAGTGFKAKNKFPNEVSKRLIELGAKYDTWTKTYLININDIPEDVYKAITESLQRAQNKLSQINSFLSDIELNLNQIIDTMIYTHEVVTVLDDVGNQTKKNVKHINTIEYELTPEQKAEISEAYTNNLQFYIKDFCADKIPEMRLKVEKAILEGAREDEVQKMIVREYPKFAYKAKFLAQNETSIMLANLKKAVYPEMGFEHFIWDTILDSRERPLHRKLHGKIFRFDEPPEIDERTHQRGLPGEAYNCRCTLTPVMLDSPFFNQAAIDEYENLKSYSKIMNY